MISSRNGNLIYGKRAVLISDVVNSVCERKDMEWLTLRYPLAEHEILECIECIADLEDLGRGEHLKLRNAGDSQDIQLETTSISDKIFLKLIQYGRTYSPECTDINLLFDKGFRVCSIEVFEDIVNNVDSFEHSDLHSEVYKAYINCLGNSIDTNVILQLLKEDET